MIKIIVIAVVLIGALVISFLIGVCAGIGGALDIFENEHQRENDLYCFECEIQMPVKEKDGKFYCTNCNLYH
jgi:hypothetical protein